MFKILLGHMSTLKKLILLKKLTSSGGGEPSEKSSNIVGTGQVNYMKLKS